MSGTDLWTMGVIAGLAGITLLARCFFFILDRPWSLPAWAHRAVVMPQGQLMLSWQDARLFAAVTGAALFFWRRSVLITLLGGMAVYLPLHLGLGW
jgi:branched-subunit amino acid transport protein